MLECVDSQCSSTLSHSLVPRLPPPCARNYCVTFELALARKNGGREPGTFYHVSDVKGRENLIARGQKLTASRITPTCLGTASPAAVLLRHGLALRTDGCVEKIKRESRVVVANGRTGGDREVPKQPAR